VSAATRTKTTATKTNTVTVTLDKDAVRALLAVLPQCIRPPNGAFRCSGAATFRTLSSTRRLCDSHRANREDVRELSYAPAVRALVAALGGAS